MDGSPNEAGSITEIIDAILCYEGHMEHTSFAVTSLGKQDIILGFTWLQESPGNQRTVDSGRPTAVTDWATALSPRSNQPEKGTMV